MIDWSGTEVPMVAIRAVHFAATAMTAGSVIFSAVVSRPSLRRRGIYPEKERNRNIWVFLIIAVISGVMWLLLQTASMSGMPLDEALTADMLSAVVNETQFGEVTTIRAGLAVCLAVCLVYDGVAVAHWLGFAAAVGVAGSLAWTGHAGATVGLTGQVHLAADVLHLVATAAWIGGLTSLMVFLAAPIARENISLARDVVERFSILGIASVTSLLISGVVNAAILVGSVRGLVTTDYGQFLILKVTLFIAMLGIAVINRFRLTPQLVPAAIPHSLRVLHHLNGNCRLEIGLGLSILLIVAILGTLHPAIHLVPIDSSLRKPTSATKPPTRFTRVTYFVVPEDALLPK